MVALDLLNKFIESGSPPDILSRRFDNEDNTTLHFEWFTGTEIDLPYPGTVQYDAIWERFQGYWGGKGE